MTKIAGYGSESGSGYESGFESGSGSISQRHGSADPDPHQNFMDADHWFVVSSDKKFTGALTQKSQLSQKCRVPLSAEAISSIIWVAPRMQTDVAELKTVADQLAAKYGKPYAQVGPASAIKGSVPASGSVLVPTSFLSVKYRYRNEMKSSEPAGPQV